MGWIRIGRFDDFKGSNTLLIDADFASLHRLTEQITNVARSEETFRLDQDPDVVVLGAMSVVVESSPEDVGLISTNDRDFVWRRSPAAWAEVADKLRRMQRSGHPCHQYLDGPADRLQVLATFGEYGEEWWNRHAG